MQYLLPTFNCPALPLGGDHTVESLHIRGHFATNGIPVQKAVINHTFGVLWCPQEEKTDYLLQHLPLSALTPTNQAEAHYKGHKHARKLKAMEAQKNRQRRAGEASSTGRERDRDRDRERDRDRDRNKTSTSEAALPALMDTSLVEGTSLQTDLEPPNLRPSWRRVPGAQLCRTPVSR
ncbi:zinc finger protein 385C, partial [Lates japonicus]